VSELKECSLRPLQKADLPMVREWRNSLRVRSQMYNYKLISEAEHHEWFSIVSNDNSVEVLIFELDGKPCGVSTVKNIDLTHGTCLWGFYLGVEDLPRGTGTLLGIASLDHIFQTRGLRKVCGEVLDFNTPSQKLFARLGFTNDGTLRSHFKKDKQFCDIFLFSLLDSEWQFSRQQLLSSIVSKASAVSADTVNSEVEIR